MKPGLRLDPPHGQLMFSPVLRGGLIEASLVVAITSCRGSFSPVLRGGLIEAVKLYTKLIKLTPFSPVLRGGPH